MWEWIEDKGGDGEWTLIKLHTPDPPETPIPGPRYNGELMPPKPGYHWVRPPDIDGVSQGWQQVPIRYADYNAAKEDGYFHYPDPVVPRTRTHTVLPALPRMPDEWKPRLRTPTPPADTNSTTRLPAGWKPFRWRGTTTRKV